MSASSTAVLVGDDILYSFSFTELGNTNPVDPTTVTVTHRLPSGVETSYVFGTDSEVTRLSLSNYEFRIRVVDYRRHHFGAFGTGNVNKLVPVYVDVPEQFFDTALPG